jgi:hypothetical protein
VCSAVSTITSFNCVHFSSTWVISSSALSFLIFSNAFPSCWLLVITLSSTSLPTLNFLGFLCISCFLYTVLPHTLLWPQNDQSHDLLLCMTLYPVYCLQIFCQLNLMKTIPLCYIDTLLYKNRHKTQLVT